MLKNNIFLSGKLPFICIAVVVWLLYSGLFTGHNNRFESKNNNYFKNLSVSFLHGRLDIDCPPESKCLDLVFFNNKYYLYWPPVPALVYIPFVYVRGTDTPDVLISTLFGALNTLLFLILLAKVSSRFKLFTSLTPLIFLGLFWGLGTVHFYMSMVGSVWFISQVMAQTWLLLALIFSVSKPSKWKMILSGFFFSLACYTRNDLVFSFFAIVAFLLPDIKNKNPITFLKDVGIFLVPFVMCTILNFYYNYARFGNVFDNGINYHLMAPEFSTGFKQYGYISTHYLIRNFVREVLYPPYFTGVYPFFYFGSSGFGLLWASPFFFLLFPAMLHFVSSALAKKVNRSAIFSSNEVLILASLLMTSLLIAINIFLIMGNGWVQFGSRYSLDYQVFIILFICLALRHQMKRPTVRYATYALILLSIFINYYGAKMFLHIP